MKIVTVNLSADDLAWVSRKLNAHYSSIRKSDELTEEEKQTEINILMNRAHAFELLELVDRFGYQIIDIPFDNERSAQLILPKKYTSDDIDIVQRRMELHFNLKQQTLNQ